MLKPPSTFLFFFNMTSLIYLPRRALTKTSHKHTYAQDIIGEYYTEAVASKAFQPFSKILTSTSPRLYLCSADVRIYSSWALGSAHLPRSVRFEGFIAHHGIMRMR